MYEITVKATIQVSATIIGEVLVKNGSFSIPHKPCSAMCCTGSPAAVCKAAFRALQQNVVTHVAAPSTLSHMCSSNLHA